MAALVVRQVVRMGVWGLAPISAYGRELVTMTVTTSPWEGHSHGDRSSFSAFGGDASKVRSWRSGGALCRADAIQLSAEAISSSGLVALPR